MALIIIESPNKIKKLKSILGSGYEVMATVGHFQKLSKKKLGFDHDTFEPNYELDRNKSDIVKRIISEAKKHEKIFIATDPDREGEAIAKHIYDRLPKRGKLIKRIKFNAITKDAVKKAMKKPTDIDEGLYLSQTARRLTDRIVGYMVSPVMWKKGLANTSAGRVQSVALKYLSDKEKEVRAFKPEEYWKIKVLFDEGFEAELVKVGKDKKDRFEKTEAAAIEKNLKTATYKVHSVTSKTRTVTPKAPFITSTLQQDASNSFNWPSKKTMNVAQSLFGAGLITYHRSDSIRVEPEKIDDARDRVENLYGKNYLSSQKRDWKNADASQDAHEAIRPTYEQVPTNLLPDEKKLLKLITSRFLASQMDDAKIDKTTIDVEATNGTDKYTLRVSGDVIAFDGFMKVYGSKKDDEVLPSVKKAQALNKKNLSNTQNFTKAPPRYTDASLVKKLEKEGVGRPSTYASIIDTLESRKYIERTKKTLGATEVGIMISDYLDANFDSLVSTEFTKNMEEALDKIASGNLEYLPVMKTFYNKIEKTVEDAVKLSLPETFKVEIGCPKCDSKMIKKISKYGPFLACQSWPACNGTRKIDGEENNVETETGKPCTDCGNIMVLRKGKAGKFWGCKSFPICKKTEVFREEGEEIIKCDKCGEGEMIKRVARKTGKPFLGCSCFPKCKNIQNIK
jgi:DNA topoisomerase-1